MRQPLRAIPRLADGADVALRCAASFLDVVGAVVYKGRTCAGQVVPTLANVHSLFGVDDYVVLRPQVLIDAFKRVVTVTVPDLPSEAERRGVRGETWCCRAAAGLGGPQGADAAVERRAARRHQPVDL